MGLFDKLFGKTPKPESEKGKVEKVNLDEIWYTTPTISNEFPQTESRVKETEHDIIIHEDDYRQREFLNVDALHLIEKELIGIKNIWTHHSRKSDKYTLFGSCHVRDTIGSPNLKVHFGDLKALLKCNATGQVIINGEALIDGFSLKTESTTYFGTLHNEEVIELCISGWDENTRREILEINNKFDLIFVNWYHGSMIVK